MANPTKSLHHSSGTVDMAGMSAAQIKALPGPALGAVRRHAARLCVRRFGAWVFVRDEEGFTLWRDPDGVEWRACGVCRRLKLEQVEVAG